MINRYADCLSNLSFTSNHLVNCEGSQFTKHYHEHFEIYVLINGKCRYLIDDTIYSVLPGDIVLIPAFHPHKTSYDTPTHSRQLIYITNASLPPTTDEILKKNGYVYRNETVADEIVLLIEKIHAESIHPDTHSNHMVAGYFQILLGIMFRNPNHYIDEHVYSNAYIPLVLKYMNTNYASNITLTQAAENCSISPEYLSRIFKSETGITFNNYLNNIRMKEAEILLMQTTMPISEIAFSIGYSDSNYFTNKFKSIHKISPTQFRNQYQKTTK